MKPGTKLRVTQKDGLATHLVMRGTKAICGTDPGPYPSYSVPAAINKNGILLYYDGSQALRHIDCKRCLKLFSK